jgi:uncharacterized membrane protein (Fun14 family)
MNIENFYLVPATIGGGFFAGILIGFALKKVIKILAVVENAGSQMANITI